jgi:hypothetical protein
MPAFLRYMFVLSLVLVLTGRAIEQRYDLEFPRIPGPRFDPQMRSNYREYLNEEKPDIVLLGDSMLKDGVNPELLTRYTGMKAARFDVPGSASAFWYLVLKNNILDAEHLPRAVVIVFRDTILTAPGYRVHGSYFIQLDEYAYSGEPVLLERSYLNLMSPLEYLGEKYLPLYGARGRVRREIDTMLSYTLPGWVGCDADCTDRSLYEIFTAANFDPGQLNFAIATAENYLYSPSRLDFKNQIQDSYLPEMIRLTREKGVGLILVRLKSLGTPSGEFSRFTIKRYISDLTDYAARQNIPFLDYGEDPRLKNEYYNDSLHLNEEGREVFTKILAEGLISILR